jgi:class 3 adenylate cyclase
MADLARVFERLKDDVSLDEGRLQAAQQWIMEAPDAELFRVNLAEWRRERNWPRTEAITVFLHLVKAGIFDMTWDIHCPQCNVIVAREESLRNATAEHPCRFCLKNVESRLDDHFEVTFTVNPAVRAIRGHVRYEPSANVEIYLRETIPPGERKRVAAQWGPDAALLRFVSWPPVAVNVVPVVTAAPTEVRARFLGGESFELPSGVPPEGAGMFIENKSAVPITLMIENHEMREYRPEERAPRLSGLEVTMVPAFRELFGSETLSDRESLKVRDVTFLFTDIFGSTALYARGGDAAAYTLVRDHFETLFEAIRRNEGTVVKTIGDAVMATFLTPRSGVAAARDALERFAANGARGGVHVRIAVHRGPCLAVTLNERLDFFGTTVNEAARIESECSPDEMVFSSGLLDESGVREALENCRLSPFQARLRGLDRDYDLVRARPA